VHTDQLETYILSFVVRIWLEEAADETGHSLWRGHITHVPSNTRRYFQDPDTMQTFIARYMEEAEIQLDRSRLRSSGLRSQE
jgi:hypothetical protein